MEAPILRKNPSLSLLMCNGYAPIRRGSMGTCTSYKFAGVDQKHRATCKTFKLLPKLKDAKKAQEKLKFKVPKKKAPKVKKTKPVPKSTGRGLRRVTPVCLDGSMRTATVK